MECVDTNNKKRYELSSDKKKIRASQGHTIQTIEEEKIYDEITDPAQIYIIYLINLHQRTLSNLIFL